MPDTNRAAPQTEADIIALLTASLVLARLTAYKACTCCDRIYRTAADFEQLPLCGSGYQPMYTEEGDIDPTQRMELRNCACRSTITVVVPIATGACVECGSDTMIHAFTCDKRPCPHCDEVRCVCEVAR